MSIRSLSLRENRLSGTIPAEIGNLLSDIDLCYNRLSKHVAVIEKLNYWLLPEGCFEGIQLPLDTRKSTRISLKIIGEEIMLMIIQISGICTAPFRKRFKGLEILTEAKGGKNNR